MLGTLRRSFRLARTSFAIVGRHPSLVVFPVLSTLAAGAIVASFLLAVWKTGVLARQDAGVAPTEDPVLLAEVFLFYLASYFTVVFFNVALLCCTQRVLDGERARLRDGIVGALGRLPAILGWSLLSAVLGVALRWLERVHPKAGALVALFVGLGWTAVSFFVVPVLVVERLGPLAAVRRSGEILRRSWGEALAGNVSVAWIGFVLMLPPLLLAFFVLQAPAPGDVRLVAAVVLGGGGVLFAAAASSAADTIFKLLLYRQATRRALPDGVDLELVVGPDRPRR
jgi:hypothetical protein